ncbi:hypothetical protein ACSSS7_008030 [Eimeria intestinalis]
MAGHADKKRAKEAAEESSRFWLTVTITMGVYMISRIVFCLGYASRLPSFYEYLLLVFSLLVLNGAHKWQQDRLLLGIRSSTATDLYFISLGSLLLGSLHPWGWCLWLAVPVYCIYLAGSKLLNWVFTPDTPDDQTPEALAFKKKQNKLERKAKSGRYTLVQSNISVALKRGAPPPGAYGRGAPAPFFSFEVNQRGAPHGRLP